ncbi:MAG: DNA polymerase III subunit delta [Bacteroidetes bacterium]|nr:DNA polymerase III subunit delta [Bacteroidota bacterium]
MTYDQIINDIRNKIFRPVYFLQGEEPFYIDAITEMLEAHVVEDGFRDFCQTVVYGRDVSPKEVASLCKAYPMMGTHQLVVVREAQDMDKIEELEAEVDRFPPSTVLVINYKYKKLDGRKSFAKKVAQKGVLFESKRPYENQIPDWISKYLKQKNYTITPTAAQLMADYLGNDLSKLRNELEKLIISLPGGGKIGEKEVETNIGISKDFSIFELQKALGQRNFEKSFRIVQYFGANSKEYPLIRSIILLYQFFGKVVRYHQTADKTRNNVASVLGVNPFFVEDYATAARAYPLPKALDAIHLLLEYDLKSKGVGVNNLSDEELYKELIFKLMNL